MPGFEIFFDTSFKLEDCEPVQLMEKDWEENMDASLFENVYVRDEIEPIGLIRSSNSPLQNWYLAEDIEMTTKRMILLVRVGLSRKVSFPFYRTILTSNKINDLRS